MHAYVYVFALSLIRYDGSARQTVLAVFVL